MLAITDLIKVNDVENAVKLYLQALDNAKKSQEAYKAACQSMTAYTGKSYENPFKTFDEGDYHKTIKRTFWAAAFTQSGVEELCSTQMRDKFHKALNENNLPEFTVDNITEFFVNLDTGSIIKDRIKTTWEYLRPHNWNEYKTNEKNKGAIGTKIIKEYVFEYCNWKKHINLRYTSEAPLRDVENTFRLMDGRKMAHYPEGITPAIKDALQNGGFTAENEYFAITGHKNGNAHITIKRPDLVQKLNQLIGKHFLSNAA